MGKPWIFILMMLAISGIVGLVWAEQITMSTYYPAPYGAYKTMKVDVMHLNPITQGDVASPEDAMVICNQATNTLERWDSSAGGGAGAWVSFVGGLWKKVAGTDDIYYDEGNVGVGTNSPAPEAILSVNGGILNVYTHGENPRSRMYGNTDTHVNLGMSSTTGAIGDNYSYCTISGGYLNVASAEGSTVGGGLGNQAQGSYATVGGGQDNSAAGEYAVIGGGLQNRAEGDYATVTGGSFNEAMGNYSWAAGLRAKANNRGAFVWADSTVGDYSSNGDDTFNIRAGGGVYYTDASGDTTQEWDIAEEMTVKKADELQEAELVSLSGNNILGKSNSAYDEKLIGVVTSERTTTLHLQSLAEPTDPDLEERYITLVGRVYVKVNKENGPIKIGDAITSSSTAGVGMKATSCGKIIGYAMNEADFSKGDMQEILVFAKVGHYLPEGTLQDLQAQLAQVKQELAALE